MDLDHILQRKLSFSTKENGSLQIKNRLYETIARKKSSTVNLLIPNAKGKVKPGI